MHENCFHDNEVMTPLFRHFVIIFQSNMPSHIKCKKIIEVTCVAFSTDIVTPTTKYDQQTKQSCL
jgi:hypothetical protein